MLSRSAAVYCTGEESLLHSHYRCKQRYWCRLGTGLRRPANPSSALRPRRCAARRGGQQACLDITEAAAVAAWIDSADRASPLELVIANAGVQGGLWRDGAGETLGETHHVMDVNFGGVLNTIHPALPSMRRRGRGQVALISSLAALRGIPFSPGYCASKAAVRIYGEAIRRWLAPEGINVSVVLPGFVATRLSQTVSGPKPLMLPPERAAKIIRRGLARGRRQIAFPYPLYLGTQLTRVLPPGLVDHILRRLAVDIGPYA